MPELPKEETQTEMGWEDLTSKDDGRPDMGEPVEPEPTPEPVDPPAEAPADPPVEPAAEEPAAAAEPVADPPEGTEEEPPEDVMYTLPGGVQVKQSDLAKDPKLLNDLVTHSNQLSHFQTLAEERHLKLTEQELANRQLLDQFTQLEMQRKLDATNEQPAQEPLVRPPAKALEGMYGQHLDQMVTDGRLTEDQRTEFGGIVSEYLYDLQNIHNLINTVVDAGTQRFNGLEQSLTGEVQPFIERREQQDAVTLDRDVQANVAARTGYEALTEPGEWNRLKLFIAEKVNASPKDAQGRPSFDPVFDGDTMAQMYDAMTGAETRAKLLELKATQQALDKKTTTLVGGETAARAGTPPQKQPSPMTPEQEAMDFQDPSMATG